MSASPAEAGAALGEPPPRPRVTWRWWALRIVPGLVALVVGVRVLASRRDELSGAASALGHVHVAWLGAAALAECASLGAYAGLQRRLLTAGGVTMGAAPIAGITLAGYAIQNSLPAGPAWSAVFAFREFRRRGIDAVLAGWTMVVAAVLSDVSLAVLGVAGVILAQRQAAGLDIVEVVGGAAAVIALAVVGVHRGVTTKRGLAFSARVLHWWQRVARRPAGDARAIVDEAARRLRTVQPRRSDWASASAFALANWLFDCACLALAFGAVGAAVPWRGLLLAYGAGQLAANLPVTPGGLGVVEGSLSIALVLYGGAQASTVAAVLLYRILSFWAVLPLGWGSWGALRWVGRRATPVVPEVAA
ncbi:MAG TPA: lysylphosphatidylglycerol synthase transmembrane domain-containing protein [Acidimicrobiales bacterium]|nr:lysylphosphatidylglycerol synthase transmembrane domain-containing protein [Acidimicrobiales bacterium]